jgi:hypothetical protein
LATATFWGLKKWKRTFFQYGDLIMRNEGTTIKEWVN